MKTITTYIETSHNTWSPQCVYYSHSTGDLLIVMLTGIKRNEILTWDYKVVEHYSVVPKKGKVNRYNQTGQLTQTIQHGNKKSKLYNTPIFLTENNNGDVVVSNFKLSLNDQYEEHGSIVVTDSKGRHRFSYTRHPSGIVLRPRGICTDALSHILSLAYDINTHRLWVGSKENNTVCVYMYIARQTGFTYQNQGTLEVREPPNETSTTENSGKVNDHLWKLISPPKLFQSLEISKAYLSLHISCVTPDQVWASNNNDLILTNIKGETLYYLKDSCSGLGTGRHTVNSESELIYVDMKYNIKILSKNMKTITTFIDRADSPWIPLCVYWCPSTGDLLVGFEREVTKYRGMGKVTRYSRTGQPTQTIEHDSAGLNLYRKPYYITENNNEDIVVSDCKNAVVVTTFGGIHLFSYTGHPSGTGVLSQGICTDPMSHILVCDGRINKIHIIDKDGQFLSHLKISYPDSIRPWSLSYDVNTNPLWIKSFLGGIVGVYRYMDRQDALTNDVPLCPDEDISLSWGPV
ncbi:uncharacterized protein [Magallana gigas]|uniref:uncharacterized protein isoform X2 n=1 Tax=Magallana gigas TaxID=29159 RepID=UPI0033400F42